MKRVIRIATRKSKLALWQANHVKSALEKQYPDLTGQLVGIVTEGDREQSVPLTETGGKSVFVKVLQTAVLQHEADIAVHSIKDMSVHEVAGLYLAAVLARADARDAFVSHHFDNIQALSDRAIVGTASPRRACLLKSMRPDVQIKLLRGNIDTRLSKLDSGDYDAIILAAAGLQRLQLSTRIRSYLPVDFFIPSIGQGVIGVECRSDDTEFRDMLHFLNHVETMQCVSAERMVNRILRGDCHTPLGAHAELVDNQMILRAIVGRAGGETILRAECSGDRNKPEELGQNVAENLLQQGARELLCNN